MTSLEMKLKDWFLHPAIQYHDWDPACSGNRTTNMIRLASCASIRRNSKSISLR